jgi:hypothetical protein
VIPIKSTRKLDRLPIVLQTLGVHLFQFLRSLRRSKLWFSRGSFLVLLGYYQLLLVCTTTLTPTHSCNEAHFRDKQQPGGKKIAFLYKPKRCCCDKNLASHDFMSVEGWWTWSAPASLRRLATNTRGTMPTRQGSVPERKAGNPRFSTNISLPIITLICCSGPDWPLHINANHLRAHFPQLLARSILYLAVCCRDDTIVYISQLLRVTAYF